MINYPRLIADLRTYGVKTDKTVTEALAIIEASKAVRNISPVDDLRSAYANGDITSANVRDTIIQAASLAAGAERIALAANAVEDATNGTLRRWIGAREDQIVSTLRAPFGQAADYVHAAARYFPPNATDSQILAGGSKAVEAREGLGAALDKLNHIRSLRMSVAECAGGGEQDASWYIDGATDLDALDAAQRAYYGSGNAFHSLAHAGFTLRLNTKSDAAKVAQGAKATTDAAEAVEREKRVAATREELAGWLKPVA